MSEKSLESLTSYAKQKPADDKAMGQTLVYNSREAMRQMKALAGREGTTLSALIGRGMNLVFKEYGMPQIAVDKPKREKP